MYKALGYFCSLKPYLKNYTQCALARLDNNPVERQVRPLALGRKNWLFLGSPRGAFAAEVFFTLIQTCRCIGINPEVYLEDVMRRIREHPYNKLEELLPDQWAKQRSLDGHEDASVFFSEVKKRPTSALPNVLSPSPQEDSGS